MCVCVFVCVFMRECVRVCVRACMRACMHVCVCARACIHVCACVCARTRARHLDVRVGKLALAVAVKLIEALLDLCRDLIQRDARQVEDFARCLVDAWRALHQPCIVPG